MTIQNHEGHILLFGSEHGSEALLEVFPDCRESFTSHSQKVWDILVDIEQREGAVSKESLIKALHPLKDSQSLLPSIVGGISTKDTVAPCIEAVREIHKQRTVEGVGKKLQSGDIMPDDAIRILEKISSPKGLARLEERRFSLVNPPEKAVPLLTLAGQPICTAGNISELCGQAKTGKSAILGAVLASCLDNQIHLFIEYPDIEGAAKGLIHFDTEQSRYDHYMLVDRAMRRAGADEVPDWFHSYTVADVPTSERRDLLVSLMRKMAKSPDGLRLVLIDGVADLCHDPNNPEEAFGLVEELHREAVRCHCAILCVLHHNPGVEKSRGHLGSQLDRKAESVVALNKDAGGDITIYLQHARHGFLPKSDGPRIAWSDDNAGFIELEQSKREVKAQQKSKDDRAKFRELATVILNDGPRAYSSCVTSLMQCRGKSRPTAERDIKKMISLGVIQKNILGDYEMEGEEDEAA